MTERPTATTLTWLAAGLVVAFALWRLLGDSGGAAESPIEVDRPPEASGRADSAGQGGQARPRSLYVHVAGAVRRPGLVRIPDGSRVADAVARAGGLRRRADLAGVNLAAELEDGQQVIVPRAGVALAGVAGATSASGAAPGAPGAVKLSLGSATLEQLEQLDGIGPTLAQRIIDYRTEHGGFGSLEELREVEGIGEKRFASLSEAVQL